MAEFDYAYKSEILHCLNHGTKIELLRHVDVEPKQNMKKTLTIQNICSIFENRCYELFKT